jgi:biopolymer transport protein ExbD
MKHGKLLLSGILALSILFTVGKAFAQEKKLNKSDLPPAVQKTADEQSKGATVKSYGSEMDHGKLQYEVQLTVNGHSKDVTIAADGSVIEVEEEVDFDALPAAVRDALQSKAGAGKIAKVESLTKHGTLVAYEAQVRTGKKHSEIQVGPNGQTLARKE